MKSIVNSTKVALSVYGFVIMVFLLSFYYGPASLQSRVQQLRDSVHSKQWIVTALKSQPKKQTFSVPKEAPDWLSQLPPSPQVNRALIQLNDIFNKPGVNFQSISLQDAKDGESANDLNHLLNEVQGKVQQVAQQPVPQQTQQQQGQQTQQKQQDVQSLTFNISVNGSYYSILDMLNQLVHSDRLFRIDSLELSHSDQTGQMTGTMTSSQTAGTQPAQQQSNNSVASLQQSLLTNGGTAQTQTNTEKNGSISPQPVLPVPQYNDTVTVNFTLTLFYMPSASFLGDLPPISLYPNEKRNNPFVP